MGKLYLKSKPYVPAPAQDDIILEIGSDRYEGSTGWFAELAKEYNLPFYSVDIDDEASKRLQNESIIWQIQEGVTWCQEVLPKLDKKISMVYLDNFDYDWDINQNNHHIRLQKERYLSYGIKMSNQNCQIAHLKQMMLIVPYTFPGSVAIFDDTFLYNDCWIGKCGPAVIYLLTQNWEIKKAEEFGVIMQRIR